jgi:hypothetical protein
MREIRKKHGQSLSVGAMGQDGSLCPTRAPISGAMTRGWIALAAAARITAIA